MSQHKITNTTSAAFDDGVTASHSTLQSAIGVAGVSQATVNTAAKAHFTTCIALALAAGISPAVYIEGLKNVGTHA